MASRSGHGVCDRRCQWRYGDLADTQHLRSVLQDHQIDAVIHFAASIAVGESVENPRLYYRNNVANSLSLLEAMHDAGISRILFSSTAAVYAPSPDPLVEDAPTAPQSPYAFSKLAIERMIQDFSSAYGLGFAVLTSVSGGAQDLATGIGDELTAQGAAVGS